MVCPCSAFSLASLIIIYSLNYVIDNLQPTGSTPPWLEVHLGEKGRRYGIPFYFSDSALDGSGYAV